MDVALGPQIRFVPPARKPFAQLLPTTPWLARVMAVVASTMPNALFQRFVKSLLVTWQHPEPTLFEAGAVLINKQGQRFTNELDAPAQDIPKQTDKISYYLFDHTLATQFSEWPHYISTAPGISYAYVKDYKKLRPDVYAAADTLPELATKIGVPVDALCETARAVNACREQSEVDRFERSSFATGLEKGPFYALGPAKSWIVLTEGGLAVNERLEVLDASEQPIAGLYAGGTGAQGGMIIWGHGLHICWAVTSGRLAAENATARLDRGN
jgi:fumarate reductase flavoprotein subunit